MHWPMLQQLQQHRASTASTAQAVCINSVSSTDRMQNCGADMRDLCVLQTCTGGACMGWVHAVWPGDHVFKPNMVTSSWHTQSIVVLLSVVHRLFNFAAGSYVIFVTGSHFIQFVTGSHFFNLVTGSHVIQSCHWFTFYSILSRAQMLFNLVIGSHVIKSCHWLTC